MNKYLSFLLFVCSPFILNSYRIVSKSSRVIANSSLQSTSENVAIIIIDHGSRVSDANNMLLDVSRMTCTQ